MIVALTVILITLLSCTGLNFVELKARWTSNPSISLPLLFHETEYSEESISVTGPALQILDLMSDLSSSMDVDSIHCDGANWFQGYQSKLFLGVLMSLWSAYRDAMIDVHSIFTAETFPPLAFPSDSLALSIVSVITLRLALHTPPQPRLIICFHGDPDLSSAILTSMFSSRLTTIWVIQDDDMQRFAPWFPLFEFNWADSISLSDCDIHVLLANALSPGYMQDVTVEVGSASAAVADVLYFVEAEADVVSAAKSTACETIMNCKYSISWPSVDRISYQGDSFGRWSAVYTIPLDGSVSPLLGIATVGTWMARRAAAPTHHKIDSNVCRLLQSRILCAGSSWDDQDTQPSTLYLVTYVESYYLENAVAIQEAIQTTQTKSAVAVVVHGLDIVSFECLASDHIFLPGGLLGQGSVSVVQIAIGAHEPSLLLPQYVVVHLEQGWSRHLQSPSYQLILAGALAVLTVSSSFLPPSIQVPCRQDQVPCMQGQVHVLDLLTVRWDQAVALGSSRTLLEIFRDRSALLVKPLSTHVWSSTETKDLDMLFFGTCSARRLEFAVLMSEWAVQSAARGRSPTIRVQASCLSAPSTFILDAQRHWLISSAKVVINVHSTESSSLEVHRVNHWLSYGKCVVSECSVVDPDLDSEYASAVIFADVGDYEGLFAAASMMVRNEHLLLDCEERSRELWQALQARGRHGLVRALGSL